MLKRLIQASKSFTPARYLRGSKFVGAGAMVFDPEGRILLIKSRLRGTWEYPAGGASGSESPHDTCRREVGEEVGLYLETYRLVGVDFWRKLTPNGNLLFTFAAEVTVPQAATVKTQVIEVTDHRWATRAEALELVPPRLKHRLTELFTAYDNATPVYLHTGQPVI